MMKLEGIKLKVDPPGKFSGTTKDNYEDFEKRLRTYLCLTDTRFPKLLKWCLTRTMPITQETMHELSNDPAEVNALKSQMNPFLYYTLMSLVGGSAYTILEQVEEENGCEAYRRLYLRYARTKMQNAIMRIATIVNMKFHDSNFETTFTEWESEMHKIEVSLNNKIDDVIKIGILIAGTTGKLHDHLCLTLGDTLSYDDTRDMVINYLKTKSLTSQTRKGPDDMDVSAVTKGKGFSFKGKGKGKGSGTTSPNKGKEKTKDKQKPKALAKAASQKVAGVTTARAILMTLSIAIAAVQKDKEKESEDYLKKKELRHSLLCFLSRVLLRDRLCHSWKLSRLHHHLQLLLYTMVKSLEKLGTTTTTAGLCRSIWLLRSRRCRYLD